MHVSIRHGFAFLCVPKCASTSIESAITAHCDVRFSGNPHLKHMNAADFEATVLSYMRMKMPQVRVEVFCLMRDPVDWVFSWYRFRQRRELANPAHPGAENYTGDICFAEFVDGYLNVDNRPVYANIATQRNYFLLPDGRMGVDRVFSMNRLDLVADFLSGKLQRDIHLPRMNVSSDLHNGLDTARRQQLRDFLARDYQVFEQIERGGELTRTHYVPWQSACDLPENSHRRS